MKDHKLQDIRNFAVVGHASSGKTMLCEAMLANGGRIGRMGSISEGTTASDYHADEREHQNSIHASLLREEWNGVELNIIDAPGYPDFIGDALGALQVADFVVIVIHAGEGIGFGTERMWEAATKLGIPKFLVINGVDREASSVELLVEQIRETFGTNVFPMTLPLDEGKGEGCTHFLDSMRS